MDNLLEDYSDSRDAEIQELKIQMSELKTMMMNMTRGKRHMEEEPQKDRYTYKSPLIIGVSKPTENVPDLKPEKVTAVHGKSKMKEAFCPIKLVEHPEQSSGSKILFPSSQKTESRKNRFDPIPISYEELYPQLLEARLITPYFISPLQPSYPKWYDADAYCEFHDGVRGHSVENCRALKHKVQCLVKYEKLKFGEKSQPNSGGRHEVRDENILKKQHQSEYEIQVMQERDNLELELQILRSNYQDLAKDVKKECVKSEDDDIKAATREMAQEIASSADMAAELSQNINPVIDHSEKLVGFLEKVKKLGVKTRKYL